MRLFLGILFVLFGIIIADSFYNVRQTGLLKKEYTDGWILTKGKVLELGVPPLQWIVTFSYQDLNKETRQITRTLPGSKYQVGQAVEIVYKPGSPMWGRLRNPGEKITIARQKTSLTRNGEYLAFFSILNLFILIAMIKY